jgi:glycosyltransferase involved in cell wall biosynthesis
MPPLLLLTPWFSPAYRAGGPITSNVNLCRALAEDINIRVFTGDRDMDDVKPFADVPTDSWISWISNIHVQYTSPSNLKYRCISKSILDCNPEVIYLTGMFSVPFTIYPLLLKWQGRTKAKVVLAPKGMLRPSALKYKPLKKRLFLRLFRLFGIHRLVHFHATDAEEVRNIHSTFGKRVRISEIPNFPKVPGPLNQRVKPTGHARLMFVGRIHPIKSLLFALQCLKKVETSVQVTIVGSKEHPDYWERCTQLISELPPYIQVEYVGELPPAELEGALQHHHFLLLPTQGENFGHAIFEAFAAGMPVIISDQTPWRNLEAQKVGWDLPLSDLEGFVSAIERAAAMDQQEYDTWSRSTHQYALDFIEGAYLKARYLELFKSA